MKLPVYQCVVCNRYVRPGDALTFRVEFTPLPDGETTLPLGTPTNTGFTPTGGEWWSGVRSMCRWCLRAAADHVLPES